MDWKVLQDDPGTTYLLVFEKGEEVMGPLGDFSRRQALSAASFTAIGAFSEATLGYFDWEAKEYAEIPVAEQVEVLSLVGDVALGDEGPAVHAHVVVGKRDGTAHGGHLLSARVRPTLELVLTEAPVALRKRFDENTGLTLIDPGIGGS